MASLPQFCTARLAELERQHLRRSLPVARQGGVCFASNDYLGLSGHPELVAAQVQPVAGATASRLVAGNHAAYAPLERQLARIKNTEAALVFGSGYLANLGAISALVGPGDLVLADKLAHACIIDGAQLSGATLKRFRHNDAAHAQALLKAHRGAYKRSVLITEHIFSMDGDKAPLADLRSLADQYESWLMVDDAHGLFTPPPVEADLWMGTLSKAAGCYGGYVAAAPAVIDYLATSARSFMFSTGLPPATCAAAHAALQVIAREPERRERVLGHARRVSEALGQQPAQSAIVPVILGGSARALAASAALAAEGLRVPAIRPPTVPPNTARLRISLSAAHTDAQIDRLIAALRTVLA